MKLKFRFVSLFKLPRRNRLAYLKYKEEARKLVMEKIEVFNKIYSFKFGRVAIRNTKSRWGSCSGKKNLNFSYRILFLPEPLADYLIVHELCHLGEFHHSQKFWNLVAVAIPDYKRVRKELRQIK
jgi:predicted metal-dependent hydrolase